MKILIISYHYSPTINPRALRWSSIAERWAKEGNKVDVISSWKPELPRKEILNNVHVHRVGKFEMLKGKLQATQQSEDFVRFPKLMFLKQQFNNLIKWIYDHTWKTVYWPDFACLWYFPAVRLAKALHRQQRYDAIVSVSFPFTGHLVGLKLKQEHPELCWLVDSGDPFSFPDAVPINNRILFQRFNFSIEKKVFSYADILSVTTTIARERYIELFPESELRLVVIPPLLAEKETSPSEVPLFPKDEKIRLVYVGTLYKKIRNPSPLLKLFHELRRTHLGDRLELHFFGNIYDCAECFEMYQEELGKSLFVHGVVPHEVARQAMKEADILVNIGNKTPYQLPSKVVEYIAAGKPILNVAQREDDSSAAFFSQHYPGCLCLTAGDDESWRREDVKAIVRFLEFPPRINPQQIEKYKDRFQAPSIAKRYLELLLKCASPKDKKVE